MFLTDEEIAELTHKQRHSAQRTVLNALGIQHKVRPDGSLLVSRAHVEQQLGGADGKSKAKKEFVPDWSGVNA